MQLLAQRLNAWRADPTRSQRIPEDLWKAAADLARVHGLSRTATELRLNYCQLRGRVSEVGGIGRPEPTPQFVELAAPMPSAEVGQHGTLELVQAWGRLTLRLPHASPRELLPIIELFVRRRS
jgi:hypothetical protein